MGAFVFRENLVEPRRRMLRRVLERAQVRGEFPAAGYLAAGHVPRNWPERVVELVISGLTNNRY